VGNTNFRETKWFKLGSFADAQPTTDGDETEPSATVMLLPIEDRYRDDGDVTGEDSKMFSLGTSMAMKTVALDFEVPVESLVREMKHSKRRMVAIAAGIAAACVAFAMFAI
jgi:hypothetical protein